MQPRKMPPDIEFEYKKIKIGDYKLTYWDEGPKDSLKICFLHGYTGDIDGWYYQVSEFSKNYRCLAHNHRCHGTSESKDEPVSIKDLAEDFFEFLDKLSILEKVIVNGHSMGGMIAQQFTLDHPDKVKALILTDTAPKLPLQEGMLDQVAKMGVYELAKLMDKMFSIPLRKRPPELQEYYKNLKNWEIERKKDIPTHVGVNFLKAMGDWDVVKRLHEIKVPTLIIFGEKDTMTDREQYSHLLAEKIPNSKLEIIKDAGHGPPTEQTNEYNRITGEFIKKFE